MTSFILFLSLLLAGPVLSVRVLAGPGCGPCDPTQCASLPGEGCPVGSLMDSCGCCSVCAAPEGHMCGGRRAAARRCGAGLECVRSDEDKKNKLGVCACKSNYEVCGSDGLTYRSGCALKSASLAAEKEGKETLRVQNKGRCATAPVIVTAPGEVYNVSGSQVYLSCEAVGVPTPVLTWKKRPPKYTNNDIIHPFMVKCRDPFRDSEECGPGELSSASGSHRGPENQQVPGVLDFEDTEPRTLRVLSGKKRMELLPGDRDNLAIQTRGGPEKHEVTGWVLISPLTREEEGSYECHATNAKGEASAVGAIYLVESSDDMIKKVTKDAEL